MAPPPGLYLALLAFLLAHALRRWWDPVPLRVWGVFAFLLLILFGQALFLGKVLLPADIVPGVIPLELVGQRPKGNLLQLDLVTQIVPWQAQVRREVRAGGWPMWNDPVGAGMPLLADPQSQWLQPLVLLALPLPLPQAVGVTAGLRVLLALVFLFLLLRRQGLSEGSALFGAISFGLGGFLLLWLNWPIANSAALLPLVLYALLMTAERGARRDFLLLIAAVFALLTGGHPETILYVAIVGSLFAFSRLLRQPSKVRWGLLGRWAAAGAIAFGLAAPALIPAARFLPQSHRRNLVAIERRQLSVGAERRSAEERRKEWDGLEKRFVTVFAPQAFGNSRRGEYWGDSNDNEDASAFVGGAALLAALLAFLPAARRFPQEKLFLVLAPASLLISLRPPGLSRLLSALPVLNESLSANRRLLLVAGFALAYVGACTVERWRNGEGPRRGAVIACAVILFVLIAWGYLLSWDVPALANMRRSRMGLQLLTVTATAALLLRRGGEGPGGGRKALWLLCALATLELLIFHRPANPSLPRSAYYPTTPSLEFLQKNAGAFRVAGIADRLLPNVPSVYGLADIRISNPFKPFLYAQAVAPVSASLQTAEHILVRPEHPLYQLLAVKYVIAPPKMKSGPGWRAVFRDPTARIFERIHVLPRLFLPQSAEIPDARPWTDWVATNPDFAERTLVLPSPHHNRNWTAARLDESAVEILSLDPARITARALLMEERLLASSLYQDGGWVLMLDGRRHRTLVANGPFVAAWLLGGEHRLDLVYRAPGLVAGLMLAAVAMLGAVLWLVPLKRW
jgi:membrane protein YfhO